MLGFFGLDELISLSGGFRCADMVR